MTFFKTNGQDFCGAVGAASPSGWSATVTAALPGIVRLPELLMRITRCVRGGGEARGDSDAESLRTSPVLGKKETATTSEKLVSPLRLKIYVEYSLVSAGCSKKPNYHHSLSPRPQTRRANRLDIHEPRPLRGGDWLATPSVKRGFIAAGVAECDTP